MKVSTLINACDRLVKIWKYRYRRFRSLSLNDFTRRMEIRSWRKDLVRFVEDEGITITSQIIRDWINITSPSVEGQNLGPEQVNSNLAKTIPRGFLADREFWKTFQKLYPTDTDKLIDYSNQLFAGHTELFGWKPVSVSIPQMEIKDATYLGPIEGRGSIYYWNVNYYNSEANPDFDVKWLWELQRFQFLLWLGAAWKITGKKKFANLAREILSAWMQNLNYPFGIEWSSNLEVGLRLLSILRCHIMCMDSPAWDKEFLSTLVAWEYLHARHVREEMTLHHTMGNHPLGESAALLFFCLVNPGLTESMVWRKFCFKTINELIPRLIYRDGVYAEQSTGYLKFVSEFMLPLIFLDKSNLESFSHVTLDRIKSSLKFVQSLSDCGKSTPMIGDSDSGCAIGWRLSDCWDFSWLLAAGSTLLSEPSLARGIVHFPVEAFLNTGLRGLNKFRSFSTRYSFRNRVNGPGRSDIEDFPVGGYHVSSDSYFKLIFDSGPLGIYPGFGHGHADALSIIMSLKNRPFLIDSGTMRYNGARDIRNYFRGTSAHNTLTIDGRSQAKALDTFKWASYYRVQWFNTIVKTEYRILTALVCVNSSYHQRTIVHFLNKGFIIRDRVKTDGDVSIEGCLHFAPDIEVHATSENKFTASLENDFLEIEFPDSCAGCAQIVRGSSDQMLGWYSRHYGQKDYNICLKYFGDAAKRTDLVTLIRLPGQSLVWTDEMNLLLFPI
jgi:hypothetical protein